MKMICALLGLLAPMVFPTAQAGEASAVSWENILQRLALTADPTVVFREVMRPLIDRPARLEAIFEQTVTDEAGHTW